jgi:hypothetical protein
MMLLSKRHEIIIQMYLTLCCAAAAAAVAKTISQFEPVTMWTDPSVVEEAKQYLADAPNVTGERLMLLPGWFVRLCLDKYC